MNAEILAVGTEILLGNIANTDAQVISQGLSELGINVYFHTVVGDNPARLREAVEIAKSRADIIITTGGLGPTYDDLTKETLAECFGKKLVLDPPSFEKIRAYFDKMGRVMTENNQKQAYLPEGCKVLVNDWGTAPGCAFFAEEKHVIMLPGPPRECRPMFYERAKPYLTALSDGVIASKNVRIYGMGESQVEATLAEEIRQMENPTIAPYAKEGECMLRITAKAETEEAALAMIEPALRFVCDKLRDSVYGVDVDSLEQVVVQMMAEKGLTLATAESCTGGLLSKRITDIAGASACYAGGVCTYSDAVKEKVLGISSDTLLRFGAVSRETAAEMADKVRRLMNADVGVGITGVAGPSGGTAEKPVGLVYIGVSTAAGTEVFEHRQSGDRARVRLTAASRALNEIRKAVLAL